MTKQAQFFRFENPPNPNPTPVTYYRRAVYMLALERLAGILDAIKAFGYDAHTGKAYRSESGDVVGRGKGIMPSLSKQFPEVRYWTKGPQQLATTIRKKKTPGYFYLLSDAIHQVERTSGQQLELFVKTAPRNQLAELPPVMFPAHKGNRRCKTCRRPHLSSLHRFHLRGAFDATHIGPSEAKHRKAKRKEEAERLREETPF